MVSTSSMFIAVAFSIFHVGLIDDVRSIEIHNIKSFAAICMIDVVCDA